MLLLQYNNMAGKKRGAIQKLKEWYLRNFDIESYYEKKKMGGEEGKILEELKRDREIMTKTAVASAGAVTAAGVAARMYGIYEAIGSLFGYSISLLDFAMNVGLGYVGAYLVSKIYKRLKGGSKKEQAVVSVGTVTTLSAVHEGIDASATIKKALPSYLRIFFNKWNKADPFDFLANVGGAILYLVTDKLIANHYERLELKYKKLTNNEK